jgi:hypothetical protein
MGVDPWFGSYLCGFPIFRFYQDRISHYGLKIALPVLGVIYGFVVISATSFIKQRPSDLNQFPDGEPPQTSLSDQHSSTISYSAQMRVWTRSKAIRQYPSGPSLLLFYWLWQAKSPFWFTRYPSSVIIWG